MLSLDYPPSKFKCKCNWIVFSLFATAAITSVFYFILPGEYLFLGVLTIVILIPLGFVSDRISNSIYLLVRGFLVLLSIFVARITLFVMNYLYFNVMSFFYENSRSREKVKEKTSWNKYKNKKISDFNHDDGFAGLVEWIFTKKQYWLLPMVIYMLIIRIYHYESRYSEIPTDTYTLY